MPRLAREERKLWMRFVFPTMTRVIEVFGKLFGRPPVLDLPIDGEEPKAWMIVRD
jgi:hypothetical protein